MPAGNEILLVCVVQGYIRWGGLSKSLALEKRRRLRAHSPGTGVEGVRWLGVAFRRL